MIVLDIKQQNSADISTLGVSPKEEELSLSFGSLLKSLKELPTESEIPDDKPVALLLGEEDIQAESAKQDEKNIVKKDLISLLQTQQAKGSKKESEDIQLNPKITEAMTNKELKVVIAEAKKYLKSKITQSDAYKKEEIDSLPKTLKGLAQLAKKIGVDVEKITLEKVQTKTPVAENISKIKSVVHKTESAFQSKLQSGVTEEQKVPQTTTAFKRDAQETAAVKSNTTKADTPLETPIVKKEAVSQKTSHPMRAKEMDIESEKPKVSTALQKSITKEKSFAQTPLFKAQVKKEITTEELVTVKSLRQESTVKKERSQQTLELLLRGEHVAKDTNKHTSLTADFSVETAKVIAPAVSVESSKNLASLLGSTNVKEEEVHVKSEAVHVAKADSFEVKLGEAKQMMKYLSQDIKTAIEDYKSPFTRVKVQLNPQKLGEVDLTIVQRGKNLHINLSSNNAAINTLAMNANDLKIQLNNSGINNASLNFSNNSQTSDGSFGSQTQQQHQQREEAQSSYSYFASEENTEEIISSLEIVVPYYA